MTLDFTHQCKELQAKLNGTIESRQCYKHEEISDDVVAFKMINENASDVSHASQHHVVSLATGGVSAFLSGDHDAG